MKALRLTWMNRLYYKNNRFTDLVRAILGIKDLKSFIHSKPANFHKPNTSFYTDILTTWFSFYNKEPTHPMQILSEPICHNKFIRVDNKEIDNPRIYKSGVMSIGCLLNERGSFYTCTELEQLFGITLDVMSLNSIKSSIPSKWLKKITSITITKFRTNETELLVSNGKLLKELKTCHCKFFYEAFVSYKTEDPPACRKWENIYANFNFDWSEIFTMPYRVARETYLQSFNFKVLNRYIACRSNLFKWNKAPSPLCIYCRELDTVEHHLFLCTNLQHFWQQLFNWFYVKSNLRMNFSVTDVIFGIHNSNNDIILNAFNFCILLAKDFIYNCKINQKNISFDDYIRKLLFRIDIERHIATSCNKLEEFQLTWNNFV